MDKKDEKANTANKVNKVNKRIGQSIKIKKYDDIFENNSDVPEPGKNSEAPEFIAISALRDFKNHPFKVAGKGIDELMESIREHGIMSPILVRPAVGGYEVISGHRRKYCAEELGLTEVPVIIRDIDDDEAVLAMVDSNIQREDIMPSEKAFAYKMKLEAIKRQGARKDFDNSTSGQVVRKLESADIIGSENNESGRQIRRYIRLTELPPALLEAVDSKKIGFNTGVELSFLSEEEKKALENAIIEIRRFPSLSQAKRLREISAAKTETEKGISADEAIDILMERKGKSEDINLCREEIRAFFPEEYTAEQIENAIIEILRERQSDPKLLK